MHDETVFKAEEARKVRREVSLPALGLIGIGVFLLATNMMGIHLIDIFWPVLVMMPGLLLLWPAYTATPERSRCLAFLAVPGAMLMAIGLLLFVMNLTGHFEAWAYSWTLVLAAAAYGVMYIRRFNPEHRAHERGRRFVHAMLMLFVGLAVFFEIIIFESFQPWLPLALIAYGLYMLVRSRRAVAVA
ncbi:MAG: hypothetical protein R3E31_21445 [Chloroflexota bacterium]|nr:hypothetical protein [Anaerolineales bacterium]